MSKGISDADPIVQDQPRIQPASDEQLQEQVDRAEFLLCLQAARDLGFSIDGPEVHVDACRRVLEAGAARGIVPSERCVQRAAQSFGDELEDGGDRGE